jgi:transcriptional antiterminator Rof (Rho-off)
VYLHCVNSTLAANIGEATHDADVYVSIACLADLRDIEEISQNHRLSKHEFEKNGFSFDIYTQRNAKLPVPYESVAAYAKTYDSVKIACIEHLLTLKLEAAIDRQASEHGRKDVKDVIRLLLVGAENGINTDQVIAFMREDHMEYLSQIRKSPEFLSLAMGNAQQAKRLRTACEKVITQIDAAFNDESQDEPPAQSIPRPK